jgi:hypothetical protein
MVLSDRYGFPRFDDDDLAAYALHANIRAAMDPMARSCVEHIHVTFVFAHLPLAHSALKAADLRYTQGIVTAQDAGHQNATFLLRSAGKRLGYANTRYVLRAPAIQQQWAHGEQEPERRRK